MYTVSSKKPALDYNKNSCEFQDTHLVAENMKQR